MGPILIAATVMSLIFVRRLLRVYRSANVNWNSYRNSYYRPLGRGERFFVESQDTGTPMLTVMGVTSRKKVTEELLNKCLKRLLRVQTCLRLCVKRDTDGVPFFDKMDDDALENIKAEVRNDSDWQKVCEENSSHKVLDSQNGPFWKCIFLPNAKIDNPHEEPFEYNCVLVVVQDHSVNDGSGSVEIMKIVINHLNDLLNGIDDDSDQPLSPPLLPGDHYISELHPKPVLKQAVELVLQTVLSFKFVTSFLLKRNSDFKSKNSFSECVGFEIDQRPACKQSTRTKLDIFNKADTKKLVLACRQNGCTVQGAIQTAANGALLSILSERGAQLPIEIHDGVPFDLRRHVMPSLTDKCALLAKLLLVKCRFQENMVEKGLKWLWEHARNGTKTIHEQIKNKVYLHSVHDIMVYIWFKYPELLPKRAKAPVQVITSSLGRFDFPESKDVQIKPTGFLYSLTGNQNGPLFETFVSTVNGVMYIGHTYFPHITGEKISEQYFTKFRQIFEMFIADYKE